MQEKEHVSMLNCMLYSIIADLLEQKPYNIPKVARRLLSVVSNDKLSEKKRKEIIVRIYYETFPQDHESNSHNSGVNRLPDDG